MLCLLCSCSISITTVDSGESSSSFSESRRSNDSFINEILEKGYDASDSGEAYHISGDFSMIELNRLNQKSSEEWNAQSADERRADVMNLLNFWAYYGDDASIRFLPSELESGITDTLSGTEKSVLEAALDFAVPDSKDKYLALIGIIDLDSAVDAEPDSTADEDPQGQE